MKILLILVGGTICTALNEKGTLSVTEGAGLQLIENFKNSDSEFAKAAEIIPSENLMILSENMTTDKWNLMLDTYRRHISLNDYDGVIFAHGTDTLAYSSAMFSLLLSGERLPVFFVSSNKRLSVATANGNDNFRLAVECISRGIAPGVYVTYKNPTDERIYLHQASRLKQCENYSDDFFSEGALDITNLNGENCRELFNELEKRFPATNKKPLEIKKDFKLKTKVLMITPYVGINYGAMDYGKFSAVLHKTFHSGTACAEGESSVLTMLDKCAEKNVDAYLVPSKPEGEVYDTVRIIAEHTAKGRKINFIYGCTNEMAYAKLLLAYSLSENKEEIKTLLNTEIIFENAYK